MSRWGLVTAWAVEHDDGRGGRMITSKEGEARARDLLGRMAPEHAGELVLWAPYGVVARIDAVCDHCIRKCHPYDECHTRVPR